MPDPALTPVSPTPGRAVTLGPQSPAWIGAAADSFIRVSLPGVADRHVALVEREDGWWASEGRGHASLNGRVLSGTIRLNDGDILEVTPGYRYQFTSGVAAPATVEAAPAAESPLKKKKKRKRKRLRPVGERPPYAVAVVVGLILIVLAAAGVAIWYAVGRVEHGHPALTDQQAAEFDSLMVVADDHVERGSSLLELGLNRPALDEFSRAVNTLALSDLRNNPDVKPRIEALEASVEAIYRERRLSAPSRYSGKTMSLTPEQLRAATLTVEQFAAAFARVEAAFRVQFGDSIEVTGRDHAEHLSLYGPGGAIDLRAKNMSREEVRFVTTECQARKIRVKDFSQDAVLQAEIRAAVNAGKLDQAGTGLHLHIDRFGGRHDRWTVTASRFDASATSGGT